MTLIYRITFGGMTNESNNINNGENNSDEPTVVTRSSSSISFRVPVHHICKLSSPMSLMTPPSVRTFEYRGLWRVKNSYY